MTSQEALPAEIEAMARAMCPRQERDWQDKLVVHSPFAPLEGQPDHPKLPRWTRYESLARNLHTAGYRHAPAVREECAKVAEAICSKYGEGAVGAKAAAAIREATHAP